MNTFFIQPQHWTQFSHPQWNLGMLYAVKHWLGKKNFFSTGNRNWIVKQCILQGRISKVLLFFPFILSNTGWEVNKCWHLDRFQTCATVFLNAIQTKQTTRRATCIGTSHTHSLPSSSWFEHKFKLRWPQIRYVVQANPILCLPVKVSQFVLFIFAQQHIGCWDNLTFIGECTFHTTS